MSRRSKPNDSAAKKRIGGESQRVERSAAQMVSLILFAAEFNRLGEKVPSEPVPVQMRLEIGAKWATKNAMTVDLRAILQQADVLSALVTYRAQFRPSDGEDPKNPSEFWKTVVTRIAPHVMFPFIRETFAGLAQKGGVPQSVLPLINVAASFEDVGFDLASIEGPVESD